MTAEFKTVYLTGTTSAGGALTVNGVESVQGFLYAVKLIAGTFDAGVDITLTCENATVSIPLLAKLDWNTSQMVYPRTLRQLGTDGTNLATHCLPFVDGVPRMVIAQGGATKTGGCVLYILSEA